MKLARSVASSDNRLGNRFVGCGPDGPLVPWGGQLFETFTHRLVYLP